LHKALSLKNPACSSSKLPASVNRRFEFHKRRQRFIGAHNETLSVAAMRVSDEDCSPARIHG
jgi:hypothetical protein